ncbi:hypothetical protein [Egicoccus halophilus]|uniref:CBS domain-containing protein n=1 Tax=Egicoccus halophilus TaxID=1670830 RepID=A0A8J3EUP8_9ACTN|nr:hypothetical protein [Egicoccus halophilus]GGI06364.1 hypothetical protein GCM10011354_18720 [Egicoccus halophilus]
MTLLERPTDRVGDVLTFSGDVAVEIDDLRRPVAVFLPGRRRTVDLCVAKPSDGIREVARRSVARARGHWSDPVIVTDGRGTAVGIVPVARLLERLAAGSGQPAASATG